MPAMTNSIDWEPIDYHQLPGWIKRVSRPRRWVRKTHIKFFQGKHYKYKVLYDVSEGRLRIHYWRSIRKQKQVSSSLVSVFFFLILIGLGCWFLFFNQVGYQRETILITDSGTSNITSNVGQTTLPTVKTLPPTTTSPPSYKILPKTTPFYFMSDGTRHTVRFTTYGGLVDYFAKESHSYYDDAEQEVIMELLEDDLQDEYMAPIITQIKKESTSPDEQARIAISIVQHIPYNWGGLYGFSMDWHYPYETLHGNKGVCADKSILLAYLLNELGYNVVLFEFSSHMAVGIKTTSSYDFQRTGYAFIETTRPTIITYVPDEYIGGFRITESPHLIYVQGGTRSLDVSQEYRDATELKKLENMGSVLDQYHYIRWESITSKYDLQYDT